jgi:hypothetical protein
VLSDEEVEIWKKMFATVQADEKRISTRYTILMEKKGAYSNQSLEDFREAEDLRRAHKVATEAMAAMINAYGQKINPLVWRLSYDGG